MNAADKLHEFFRNRDLLLTEGTVVWGATVQANTLLFKPGNENHPALVVYSPDPAMLGDLDGLVSVARRLFSLKGTAPKDPDQARFAEMITNEMERGLGWTVPVALTGGELIKSTDVLVFREHLRKSYLTTSCFPLLIHPNTPAAMIVPARYWPENKNGNRAV